MSDQEHANSTSSLAPLVEPSPPKLTDLLNVNTLQRIQDLFVNITGITTVIRDEKGEEIGVLDNVAKLDAESRAIVAELLERGGVVEARDVPARYHVVHQERKIIIGGEERGK